MGALRLKTLADLRRRRLQTAGITLILLLATAAGTLALSILVESHAPFDRAFEAANGAHLVIRYRGDVDPGRLAATATSPSVTGSAGPWPVIDGALDLAGYRRIAVRFAGRPRPDASIDAVTINFGRWWQAPGEVVLGASTARLLGARVGDIVAMMAPPSSPKSEADPFGDASRPGRRLTVVGVARSVTAPETPAWASPDEIAALVPERPADQEMLYRVTSSATAGDLGAATTALGEGLPAGAVLGATTYLELRAAVDQLADLYVPVLIAFSTFALLTAVFLIANIISGVVLTSYCDIGVMKAVGFTPGQVRVVLAGQVLAPAVVGSVVGVLVGTIASGPIVRDTAESFGLPSAYTASGPVVIVVLGVALATCLLATVVPAVRAGGISAADAIVRGSSPSTVAGGTRLRSLGLAFPIGLPGRLGVSASLARPVRTSMMLGALVVGVAATTFALGLNWSLLRVITDLDRAAASPIRIETNGPGITGGKRLAPVGSSTGVPAANPAEVSAAIGGDVNTAHSVAIGQLDVTLPGMGALPLVGYQGDATWLGYALIEGRWFSGPGEVVAPTAFFTRSGLHVGDSTTLTAASRSVAVRLVGEIFDTPQERDDGLVLRGSWADLVAFDTDIQPGRWEAQPVAGIDPRTYRSWLQQVLGPGAQVTLEGESFEDASFLLFLSVVGLMGVVLVAMSLGGVFDTVLLETRQRTREVAVLKALGLTPAQVVAMVIATVVPVGLIAGAIGVPIGLAAQRLVLTYMGQVAAGTRIPEHVYDVFPFPLLIALGLVGLVIGAIGAYLPARWAAHARIAPVLQAE